MIEGKLGCLRGKLGCLRGGEVGMSEVGMFGGRSWDV